MYEAQNRLERFGNLQALETMRYEGVIGSDMCLSIGRMARSRPLTIVKAGARATKELRHYPEKGGNTDTSEGEEHSVPIPFTGNTMLFSTASRFLEGASWENCDIGRHEKRMSSWRRASSFSLTD